MMNSKLNQSDKKTVRIYLSDSLKNRAVFGRHLFLGKLENTLMSSSFEIEFVKLNTSSRADSLLSSDYKIFLMQQPLDDRSLTIRKNYLDQFWTIENTAPRWDWSVARTDFDGSGIDPERAKRFVEHIRIKYLWGAAPTVDSHRYVYVPLQGKLSQKRSFQYCSPLEMLEATLQSEPSRLIIATLHPREDYTKSELISLDKMAKSNPRLIISNEEMKDLLVECDYVVTQNSSVAFWGYFLHKPSILFAKIDFHHIALKVDEIGVEEAFWAVDENRPDFDRYLWWFLQVKAINAQKPEAERDIARKLAHFGWPVAP